MRIVVNGKSMSLPDGATVLDVLSQLEIEDHRGIAVAVGSEVVPAVRWGGLSLSEGQRLEVLRAVQGG